MKININTSMINKQSVDIYFNLAFILDVMVCSCLLYNELFGQIPKEVACFLEVLQSKDMMLEVDNNLVLDIEQKTPT